MTVAATSALGRALAAVDAVIPAESPVDQLVIGAKVKGMLVGYDARWRDAEWELEGDAERVIQLPIVNPETGRSSRTFTQAGKFDGIVSGYSKRVLLEHKSTSDDIADPNSVYWRRLAIDSQVSKYMLQTWQLGEKLDGALYDVLRKPAIRPKKLAKADLAEITTKGTYCGQPLADDLVDAILCTCLTDENPTLYGLRVAAETCAQPDRYFQRRMIPRLDDDVLEYAEELWAIADEIRLARVNNRHFRNSSACLEYGRPCEYLGICSGFDTPESDKWRRIANVHEELPGVVDGRDVLTNSRMKCFQSCRRKHQLRYEEGLRRVDADEAEALFLGSVLHLALAEWWTPTKGEQHGGNRHDSAVNAIAESVPAAG